MLKNSCWIVAAFVVSGQAAWAGEPRCFSVQSRMSCLEDDVCKGLAGPARNGACDASRALKRASSKAIGEGELRGGKEPGAVLCRKLSGDVVVGADSQGNQQGFCVFADGSLLTTSKLWKSAVAGRR
jgi:hypothetical protein